MRPEATMSVRSPLFLIDVDPKSPERGSLIPLESRYFASSLRYIPARTLALKPVAGFILRPGTLYAAVLRRDLGDRSGRPLGTAPDFEKIKSKSPHSASDAAAERARSIHADVFDYLASLGAAMPAYAASSSDKALVGATAGGATGGTIGFFLGGPVGAIVGGWAGAVIGGEAAVSETSIRFAGEHPVDVYPPGRPIRRCVGATELNSSDFLLSISMICAWRFSCKEHKYL